MVAYFISFVILARLSLAQDIEDYDQETVSEWSSGPFVNDLNQQCLENCNKTCVQPCPVPKLCKDNEIECGKKDLPVGVWPDCQKDDICVPDGCVCKYKCFNFST